MDYKLKDFAPNDWVVYWHFRSWCLGEVMAVNKTIKITGVYGSHTLMLPHQIKAKFSTEDAARTAISGITNITAKWNMGSILDAKEALQKLVDERQAEIDQYIKGAVMVSTIREMHEEADMKEGSS